MGQDTYFQEFYPPGADGRSYERGCVEIANSMLGHMEDGYTLTLWLPGSNMGNNISGNVPIRTLEKARWLAKVLYHALLVEADAFEAVDAARRAEWNERDKARWVERQQQQREELEARMAKITPETPRVTMYVCPSCEHQEDSLEAFALAVYECGRCGAVQVGEENRRCESCNVFMAKVGELACENCEAPLDEDPEAVVGVEVDGVFVSQVEITKHEIESDLLEWVNENVVGREPVSDKTLHRFAAHANAMVSASLAGTGFIGRVVNPRFSDDRTMILTDGIEISRAP